MELRCKPVAGHSIELFFKSHTTRTLIGGVHIFHHPLVKMMYVLCLYLIVCRDIFVHDKAKSVVYFLDCFIK